MATIVKFLKDKVAGQVTACFPYIKHGFNGYRNDLRTCYSHVGQHSSYAPEWAKTQLYATPEEYADLLAELKSVGYDDLKIIDGVRTIDKIITKVDCKYGAPMGRADVGTPPTDGTKVYDTAVPMSGDGSYCKGGCYFGIGNQLRVKYTKDLSYVKFYRKGEE